MANTIRPYLFNTVCLICGCVFIIFEIQSTIFDKKSEFSLPPPVPYTSNEIQANNVILQQSFHENKTDRVNTWHVGGKEYKIPQIWITMGLCWSTNTKYHGKQNFPYKEAAPLSAQLWMRLSSSIKVILQVVYSEPNPPEDLIEYKKKLEGFGVVVKLVPKATEIKCVLEAQLIRIVAYLLPEVKDQDILVTADVDAFPMTKELIAPIVLLPDTSIWLYRYGFSLGTGSTFMMPFIGSKARVWKDILRYDYDPKIHSDIGQGLGNWIKKYADYFTNNKTNIHESNKYTWEVDQHITSRAIMASGLCSLPSDNGLWTTLSLEDRTPKEFDDSSTCWHGGGIYEDCNNKLWTRNIILRHRGGNCKWWHFYPDETYDKLEAKFNEIVDGNHEGGFLNNAISMARKLEMNSFGRLFGP